METKTMQEVLKENQERHRKFIKEAIKENKKQQKVEKVIITLTMLLILSMLFIIMYLMNEKQIKNCINAGNTIQYCKNGIN